MYKVFARKYRPSKLSEVIGQPVAVKIIENAIKTNRLHHAILLYGPMGTGKTSIARIIAKSLNCENGPTVEPCGRCEACDAIGKGKDVDVIEIDGASNRKIENARNIIESVKYPPLKRRFKIYIIDEVHMFTMEAFNAMLKTIEEPPPYVKFIFATTAIEKVPDTILSRCQILTLKKIPESEIVKKLKMIAEKEGIEIENSAIELLAFASNGSLRVAEGLLDRCHSYKPDGKITVQDVSTVVGIPTKESAEKFLNLILSDSTEEALNILKELSESSINLSTFNRMVLDGLIKKTLSTELKAALLNIFYKSLFDIKQKIDPEDALVVATFKAKAAKNLERIEEIIEKAKNLTLSEKNSKTTTEKSRIDYHEIVNKTKELKKSENKEKLEEAKKQSRVDLILNTLGGKIISIEKLND